MIRVATALVLIGLITVTAIAIIYSKYHSRVLFSEIQNLERKLDSHELEWGRLQLELNTLAAHERVESFAHEKLGMTIPKKVYSLALEH